MSNLKGFMGQILEIDLTTKSVKTTPLDEKIAEKFLGGAGYATAALFPLINKDTDPLGPDNILFFMTGPLLGTSAVCTGRMAVCAKSPVTGILGESNTGSFINLQIKKAGYDGIMIRGASDKPVYIKIVDDQVEIKDAGDLWGKNIYETSKVLKESEDLKMGRVMCIGPAGENLVQYSIIASNERAFGRCGMGAIMGSKKLKAVIVRGTKNKVEIAKPDEFKVLSKEVIDDVMGIFTNQVMGALGTSANMNLYTVMGELPVKYFRTSSFPAEDSISGATLAEKYLKKQRKCFACPVGCGRVVEIGPNDMNLPEGEFEGPEYETIASFGSIIDNSDLLQIVKVNYLCNDLGVDTIETGGLMGLLMDNIEKGKISASDLDGIDLKWGNMDAVSKLIEKIAKREGIGDILAKGANATGKNFGIDQEQIATIKDAVPPYHDLRSSFGMAIAYAASPNYGASHCACDMYMTSLGQAFETLDIDSVDRFNDGAENAAASAKLMEYRAFTSSVIMCVFGNPQDTNKFAKLVELVVGIPFDLEKLKTMGDRILSLKRLFNLKMGHSPKDEKIPKILLTPLEGGTEGKVPDMDKLMGEFYKYEQWDPVTGMPSAEKIERLSLSEYSKW
ncbi:MAG: aldehyde ferredoxin oxidoreductase family protein [archaeon]|nr:aldehyde ferredoxin oxidoreductase family protein [archaeon]